MTPVLLLALALSGTGTQGDTDAARLVLAIQEEIRLAVERGRQQAFDRLIQEPSVTGTWLSPTEISVQASVPPVGGALGGDVAWYLQVYRYPQGSSWPERVATTTVLVEPGKSSIIGATLAVPRPLHGSGSVIVRAAHDSASGLDVTASVGWPYLVPLRDDFESCGTSHNIQHAPLPCTPLWRWSAAAGYDPTRLFEDGFESGTASRWTRSVP